MIWWFLRKLPYDTMVIEDEHDNNKNVRGQQKNLRDSFKKNSIDQNDCDGTCSRMLCMSF